VGEVHGAYALPSKRHAKVEPGSLAENVKVALVALVGLAGLESIVVCGAAVSTTQV
jgi:hypothetical protein